jgi:hypothetical protein
MLRPANNNSRIKQTRLIENRVLLRPCLIKYMPDARQTSSKVQASQAPGGKAASAGKRALRVRISQINHPRLTIETSHPNIFIINHEHQIPKYFRQLSPIIRHFIYNDINYCLRSVCSEAWVNTRPRKVVKVTGACSSGSSRFPSVIRD